jgi:hypothetical protein
MYKNIFILFRSPLQNVFAIVQQLGPLIFLKHSQHVLAISLHLQKH